MEAFGQAPSLHRTEYFHQIPISAHAYTDCQSLDLYLGRVMTLANESLHWTLARCLFSVIVLFGQGKEALSVYVNCSKNA
ncbi:hypothetical protein CCHR01_09136 [Colletotrichum chrysophilum]|nr:hypothetical protein CCHR01_09136 [Colletotrichum chrysophilum]